MSSLFLNTEETETIKRGLHEGASLCEVFWPLERRARRYCEEPGWSHRGTTVQWWHAIADYSMTVAGTHALRPSPQKAAWLRETALAIARRPEKEWVGPAFRSHDSSELVGNLETAHLTWAIVFALDLAPEVFSEPEREELMDCLREKSMPLCQRWFDQRNGQNNWGMIMLAGLTLAGAILRNEETLRWCAEEYHRRLKLLQDDGSYGEGLQYASYAIYGLTLTGEALRRYDLQAFDHLTLEPFVRTPRWWAQALLYIKPLAGWGSTPMPRSANFNDSAAVFRPHGDVLMHIAARAAADHPTDAGIARWLFERLYNDVAPGPEASSGTFGFVNEINFLSLLLYPRAAAELSPQEAGLATVQSFDCGETYVRSHWQANTILAVKGETTPLRAKSHRHRDSGAFILVHNRERILLDPGHSCYRSALRELDLRTDFHNTCTFSGRGQSEEWERRGEEVPPSVVERPFAGHGSQENKQRGEGQPLHGHLVLSGKTSVGGVSVVGYELAPAYDTPLQHFLRFWVLCGEHALFVVDLIEAEEPVLPAWNWLFNNRDDLLDIEQMKPGRLVGRRGDAGFKFTQPLGGSFDGPAYHFVHDAYHPLPGMKGEGRPGSGLMFRTRVPEPARSWKVVHPLALDSYAQITGWHAECREEGAEAEIRGYREKWTLTVNPTGSEMKLAGPECCTINSKSQSGVWRIT